MLALVSELLKCNIEGRDGEIGKVKDIYIDNQQWTIRYVLADTWKTLPGRRVVLSPSSFESLDLKSMLLNINLDKGIVRESPNFTEKSVLTFETEEKLANYYGWPKYWEDVIVSETDGQLQTPLQSNQFGKMHSLHPESEMTHFRVHAADGRLGKIVDMIFDVDKWTVQSFVIKLKYQSETGLVLLSAYEIASIEWVEGDMYVGETLEGLKGRPIYRNEKELHEYLPNL
ncbi:hypothetical protein QR721_04545 [Aciduricibacillus chroicocephali]|uniref:PRC-barrel domain-containing protein n=1 Tax=Aciduricibacillus chroicocephali TaxID=3054939 RepID=A0ABY9KX90_9BACI|nr:hypothetical protein QR721_04545 [Bacillaceae bacterium 44XB]